MEWILMSLFLFIIFAVISNCIVLSFYKCKENQVVIIVIKLFLEKIFLLYYLERFFEHNVQRAPKSAFLCSFNL